MRTSVHDLLDGMTAEALDHLTELPAAELSGEAAERIAALAMEKAGITDSGQEVPAPKEAIPLFDDADSPVVQREPKKFARRLLLIAACLILITVTLAGCYIADAVEYSRAMDFFDLNNLNVEGLNRSDIKRVWRDITTERFDYDKSMQVLAQNTDTSTVVGADIQISNYMNNANMHTFSGAPLYAEPIRGDGVCYSVDEEVDEDSGVSVGPVYFGKFVKGERAWQVNLGSDFSVTGFTQADGIVYVYGCGTARADQTDDEEICRFAAVSDDNGTVLWEKPLDSHHHDASIDAVLPEGDGAVLFSTASDTWDFADRHLIVQKISRDGQITLEKDISIDELMYIGKAAVLSDGYLIEAKIGIDFTNGSTRLLRLSQDGDVLRELNCGSEDFTYEISDIRELDGRIFISATARPVDSKLYENTGDYDEETIAFGAYTEEWRDRARQEFSAVLFVLDLDSGQPGQFWSVQGALAGELGADENDNLTWQAKRIIACGYSPYTSSFSIYGYTREYDYTFDRSRNLLTQTRTDIIGGFRDH